MTQQILNNGATFLEQRTKINANTTELYASKSVSEAHAAATTNPHSVTKAQVGLSNAENKSFLVGVADGTMASTSKTTPVDADYTPLVDSSAANGLKKLSWGNLKATLKVYFDTVYQSVLVSGTSIKTINGQSVIGGGDLSVVGSGSGANLTYTSSPTQGVVVSDTGTDATLLLADGTNAGLMAPAGFTKLTGIATGATANSVSNLLTNASTTDALSAAQGKVLKDISDSTLVTLSGKQVSLVSGTNIKTVGGTSLLGSGDIPLTGATIGTSQATIDETILYSGGLPVYDLGDAFVYKGIPVSKVSNGVSFRYVPNGGTTISPKLLNYGRCLDVVGVDQYIAEFNIPGGVGVHNDQLVISFTLLASAAFGSTSALCVVKLVAEGSNLSQPTWTKSISSTSVTTQTFTLTLQGFNSNVLVADAGWAANTDNNYKRVNLLQDYKIQVGYRHAGTATGRSIALDTETLTNRPKMVINCLTEMFLAGGTYKDPTIHPFKSDAFMNVPLPTTATYADETTDVVTAAITGYGGIASGGSNPVGNNYGGKLGSTFNFILGFGSIAIEHFQMSSSDQFVDVSYTSKSPGAPWPFTSTGASASTIKMRLPAAKLPTGQAGDDIVLLVTPCKRYIIESGGYSYDTNLNKHSITYVNVHDMYGSGISTRNITPYSAFNIDSSLSRVQESYRASGLPVAAGLVRGREVQAGVIEHMLSIQCGCAQQRAGTVAIVSASGTTFVVKCTRPEYTGIDYTPLFPDGDIVYYAGVSYTCVGVPIYDGLTGRTTLTVTATITGSAAILNIGGDLGTDFQRNKQYVWPATSLDNGANSVTGNVVGYTGYQGVVRMGEVFAIPPSVNLSTLGLSATGLIVATAFQKYGGYNCDTTVDTFGLCQIDYDLQVMTSALNELYADKHKIRAQLRRVTNYSKTLIASAARDVTLSRALPLPPMYGEP